ncbi:hypothetical protein ACE02P_17990 [Shewanella bicestrii]
MDIFSQTVGISASALEGRLEWLLTAALAVFCVVVIKGTYERWQSDDMSSVQVWIDVVLAFSVCIGVATYFKSFS